MPKRHLLLLIAALAFCQLAAASPADLLSHPAPDFTVSDLNHKQITLKNYHGKIVLLNFWATWCGPCLLEIPQFKTWQQTDRERGLQIIGISMDDSDQPVRAAYGKLGLNFPVAMGNEKLGDLFGGILGLPVTFLIDRKGRVRFVHTGDVDLTQLAHEIDGLLSEH